MSFDQSPPVCDLGQSPALAGPFEPAPANYLRDARLHPTLPERHDSELPKLDKLVGVYDKGVGRCPDDVPSVPVPCRALLKNQRGRPPVDRGLELLEQSALVLRVASKLAYDENETDQEASDAIGRDAANIGNVEVDLIRSVMG